MTAKETILGVDVTQATYESLTAELFQRINDQKQSFIVAINPEKIMKAQKDEKLRTLLNSADYHIPDGVGVLIASRLKGGNIKTRITGIDLMMRIIKEAANQQKSIFLYGAKPGVADQAAENVKQQYPDIQIKGTIDGYQKDMDDVIKTINQAEPDILFVALGSPKQEQWIRQYRNQLKVSLFQGVGGSFDVLAGNIERAPAAFRNLGLEWLYRLIREPWRWKRQLALPRFLIRVFFSRKGNHKPKT
ncbi:MAG: WecB/TagA/CpsF family glycosyltransferase [Bacillaceae bacterium]|nr:WecB/TagA/CpsF family glycosyltransferase [Bacillaceae bacterium]